MSAPRWAQALLWRLAEPAEAEEVVGDLEEAHRRRRSRHGRLVATVLTAAEALDVAWALVRTRRGVRSRQAYRDAPAGAGRRTPLGVVSALDLRLGVRMLAKYPAVSVVSVLGVAVAVAIGSTVFSVALGMTSSPLPLHEGERIVAVENVGPWERDRVRATHLHDLERWRTDVAALGELGAYRVVRRNVTTPDGRVAPTPIAEITASGFQIARVPPLRGRWLIEADEERGAPAVVVIGEGVWRERFGGRPDILGRWLEIGGTPHEVVGVMPRSFAFPVNNRVWTPLRLNASDYPIGGAPGVQVFGRLAPGATLTDARAQLAVVGERAAAEQPATHERLRPRVVEYTAGMVSPLMERVLYLLQLVVTLLLVVIAINVGTLVYARTITRGGEIAVRTALGASRGRIAMQLFVESFVLSSVAAIFGLLVAGAVTERIESNMRASAPGQTPFWWDFGLAPVTAGYALGLAVLAAVIIGVVPAMGATGRRLQARLQAAGTWASGPRLGRTWTALLVAQIAVAVAILPVGLSGLQKWGILDSATGSRYPLGEVLVGRLEMADAPGPMGGWGPEADPDAAAARYGALRDQLIPRLETLGEVAKVAPMTVPPWQDPDHSFEIEGGARGALAGTPAGMESASSGHRVGRSEVSPAFFEVLDLPALSGRVLREGDASSPDAPVVVNQPFVDLVMGGVSPIGRRLRFLTPWNTDDDVIMEGRWHTIVGVVPHFMPRGMAKPEATAYLAVASTDARPVTLAIRVRGGDADRFVPRIRDAAAGVNPALLLEDLESLQTREVRGQASSRLLILTVAALSLSVLLLAIAGLYALMSFTVARRRREIGIRMALGARPQRVLRSVLGRAAGQLTVGVLVGLGLALVVDRLAGGEIIGGREAFYLPGVAALMAAIGLLAAWGPARRGLAVAPTEALRDGG